jgi:hypothetical protein
MAKKDKAEQPEKQGRIRQIREAYKITKQADKRIGLILLAIFVVTFAVVLGLTALLWHWLVGLIIALPIATLPTMWVFGRRAEKAAYAQYEGQPGAAAAALGMLKRGWDTKPGVAFTKNQDVVHRAVGRPGIVLIGEGQPNRVRNLLTAEKRKHARAAGDVPIYDIVAGNDEGQVPVRKLGRHVMKLPRNLRPAEVTDVIQRLRALDAMRPQVPAPKGPMPSTPRQARAQSRQATKGR